GHRARRRDGRPPVHRAPRPARARVLGGRAHHVPHRALVLRHLHGDGEIERSGGEQVTERELARAKAYLLGNLAMDRRTNARHAWYLAFFEVTGTGWDFPERYMRAVEAVTAADVARVAGQYLMRPTVVVLQPPRTGT